MWRKLGLLGQQLIVALLLFCGANLLVYIAWQAYATLAITDAAKGAAIRSFYADMSAEQFDTMYAETWETPHVYQPWVGFREAPRSGDYVNVDPDGFRLTSGSANHLDGSTRTIFFFGGSTTFGYNVPDEHTIPSYFQRLVPEFDVYNFGRGFYYSKQENALLVDLVDQQRIPEIALFLDGINERCDGIRYRDNLSKMFDLAQDPGSRGENSLPLLVEALLSSPAMRAIERVKDTLGWGVRPSPPAASRLRCDDGTIAQRFARRLALRDAMCRSHGVRCLTFLQPFAGTHGIQTRSDLLAPNDREYLAQLYRDMAEISNEGYFDVSDALADDREQSYVDNVHYSPDASRLVANAIFAVVCRDMGWDTCDATVPASGR